MFTPQMVFHLKNVLRILKTISGRSQRQTLGFLPRISPIPYGNLRMAPDRSILGRTFRYKESGADPHRETGRLAAMVMCQRGGVSCRLRHRNLPVKRITEPPPTNIYIYIAMQTCRLAHVPRSQLHTRKAGTVTIYAVTWHIKRALDIYIQPGTS